MSVPLLATKLYLSPPRSGLVPRPRLIQRLNEGLLANHKLTLISAPAGFGKTTLAGEWLAACECPVAWLSLDEGDNEPARFLSYLLAALQTINPGFGEGLLAALQSPQPPPTESILTALLNEITTIPDSFILALDDYHVIDSEVIDQAITFLLGHLPPQMHLVIATREDPQLPQARLRAGGQLTELRADDLRFTSSEAFEFLNRVMALNLSAEDIGALETRTEGWIVGLQLAAISMRDRQDASSFIKSFTGSHRFVLDYLVEEVLERQPENIQTFLLRTSILNRMCGPLCDAVTGSSSAAGHTTLEYLERANLFIVPLDNERRWYRYHHLFTELLRQRLQRGGTLPVEEDVSVTELHRRASQWYEENRLEIEAFHHATSANDIERAVKLIGGKGMPLYFRGGAVPILKWLESLPKEVLDARPELWVTYASAILTIGLVTDVEQKVQAAEAALQNAEADDKTRDLIGRIASVRATLAVTQHKAETIITQSRRALEYLNPNNIPERAGIIWKLGYAYHLQGDRTAARRAYTEALSTCEAIGRAVIAMMAAMGLGTIQETDNQLPMAAESYHHALQLGGDPTPPPACDAYLGLARIFYQWNDLDSAQHYAHQSLPLARQIVNTDRSVLCEIFIARLMLAKGDVAGAGALLERADQSAHRHNFVNRIPEIADLQVLVLLCQEELAAAAQLAGAHPLPLSQARVYLARGNPAAALEVLEPLRQQMASRRWADEILKVTILQALAHHAHCQKERAIQLLAEALSMAEPGGFIRIFIDEGERMRLLIEEYQLWISKQPHTSYMPIEYVNKLLLAFTHRGTASHSVRIPQKPALIEPLSERELEVLRLLRSELSGPEIAARLIISLHTLRTHTNNIYKKLGVNNRRTAVRRAEELEIL